MAIENLKLYNHIKDKLFNSIGIDSKVFEEETFQKEIEKLNPDYLPKKHINSIKQYLKIYNDFLKTQNISINLRYYQVLAIVFTQYYLFEKDDSKLQEFSNSSLAYWMATGSGKTIIMYINILQYIKKIKNFEQLEIILTTPQTNLIEQHKKEIIPFIEYLNQIYNNKIKLIIETTQSLLFKVRQEKNYFDVIDNSKFKRLVLVDEAHIGGSSDEGKYYELRKNLNKRNSFLFEYSATFHNVKDKNYENSIIFDYSYPKFYKDGYGKDFYLDTIGKDIDNNPQKNLNRSLLILQEKINSYMNYRTFKDQKTLTEFKHQDKPLIAFMGNTVFSDNSKDENTSDIKEILNYLANLSIDEKKNFSFVFNNEYVGNLKLTRNKTVSDEILLSYGNGKFFGILNIGGGEKFLRELEIENVIIETANLVDDKFKFINIDDRESPINILIGSRKFTEGWNSFRLSIINLLNIGKGKGNTIIQVFGRGVRLRGLKGDGKRYFKEADKKSILSWDELSSIEDEDEKNLKKLQTLVITSFDKTYLQTFTNEIHNEIKYYSYFNIPVQPQIINLKSKKLKFEEYSKKLPIFKLSKIQVNNKVIEINNNSISYNNREIEKFKFNLDYRLDKEKSVKENCINRLIELNNKYYNYLSSSLFEKKIYELEEDELDIQIYYNNRKITIMDILQSNIIDEVFYDNLEILSNIEKLEIINIKILEDFYKKIKNKINYLINSQNTVFDSQLEQGTDFVKEYSIRVEFDTQKDKNEFDEEINSNIDKIKNKIQINGKNLQQHIFEPLLYKKNEADVRKYLISPDYLNQTEYEFISRLNTYIINNFNEDKDKEFYLMRNSQNFKSIGIYLDSDEGVFYPDFIMWVIDNLNNKIYLNFFDPKGQRGISEEENPQEFNQKILIGVKEEDNTLTKLEDKFEKDININSFIILPKSSMYGKNNYREVKEEQEKHNIFRIDGEDLFDKIFDKIF